MRKVVRDEESEFAGIRQCIAKTQSIVGGNSGVERKLVPVRQRVACFQGEAAVVSFSSEVLNLILHANSEARRQSHFDLLPEKLTRQPVTKHGTLISGFELEAERRKNVRLREGRDATVGHVGRSTVGRRQLFSFGLYYNPSVLSLLRIRCGPAGKQKNCKRSMRKDAK